MEIAVFTMLFGVGVDGNKVAHVRTVSPLFSLSVAGKEHNDPIVILHLLGQLVAQNLDDFVPRCVLIEQGSGLEAEGFELFLHRPGILYGIFEGR